MNTMKKMTTMLMFGLTLLGGTVLANEPENSEPYDATVSVESETVPSVLELAVKAKGLNPWLFRLPIIAAVIATGGLAAAPLLSGAVSAEVAAAIALALIV